MTGSRDDGCGFPFHWRLSPKRFQRNCCGFVRVPFGIILSPGHLKTPARQPRSNRRLVHLALTVPFGAMDRQAPEQECDDMFV